MKRITIEVTEQQQHRLKAMAALQGKSIKDFVLANTIGDADEAAALEDLEELLKKRLANARAGGVSSRSVGEIFEAAFRENVYSVFMLAQAVATRMIEAHREDREFRSAIVNVSAMEGQFYRAFKTDKHPHTNMAKAALNMMTRTSAADYVDDGIHMNSVDTGWVTDEDPIEIARRKTAEHGFHPPLDIVDGAARICDPIFDGFLSGRHVWGLFLKDYKPVAW